MKNRILMISWAAAATIAVIGSSSNLYATTFCGKSLYYTNVHYSKVAFGKTVQSVVAELGVLQKSDFSADAPALAGSKKIQLVPGEAGTLSAAGLIGKAVIEGIHCTEGTRDLGPKVRYEVQFDDGSSLKTDLLDIPVSRSETAQNWGTEEFQLMKSLEDFRFKQPGAITSTESVKISGTENF